MKVLIQNSTTFLQEKEQGSGMTDKELKKLSRLQLVELLLDLTRKLDDASVALEEEKRTTEKLKKRLADRQIMIDSAGSIAESSLQLGGVFTAAQKAASVYLENIERLAGETEEKCRTMEAETEEKCRVMEEKTRKKCQNLETETEKRCRDLKTETEKKCRILENETEARVIAASQMSVAAYVESMEKLKAEIGESLEIQVDAVQKIDELTEQAETETF